MTPGNVFVRLWVACVSRILKSTFSFPYTDLLTHGAWRSALLEIATPRSGARVLVVCTRQSSISADLLAKYPSCSLTSLNQDYRSREAIDGIQQLSFEQGLIGCEGASFDKVVCCMALHPLASPGKLALLKEMRRVLRSRGDLYLADLDKASPNSQRETMALLGTYGLYGSDSAVVHNNGTLSAQIELAGFSHVKQVYNEPDVIGRVSIFHARR